MERRGDVVVDNATYVLEADDAAPAAAAMVVTRAMNILCAIVASTRAATRAYDVRALRWCEKEIFSRERYVTSLVRVGR